MGVVKLYIDKFQSVVKIDEDHPLAIAQREKDAAAKAAPKGASKGRVGDETPGASK